MTVMNQDVQVAIADNFIESCSKLPADSREKAFRFLLKFKRNPLGQGANLEKLTMCRDKNLYSARIDKASRAILKKSESGSVLLLLWADTHDEAYRWAQNRVCEINPETGAIQLYTVDEQTIANERTPEGTQTGLFANVRDRHLLKLGVPKALLPKIRRMQQKIDLIEAEDEVPRDCFEALTFLADGEPLEDVLLLVDELRGEQERVDTSDFEKALINPYSQQKFYVGPSEKELKAALDAPLEKWRVFLHPSQRKIVQRDWNGPVRLLGGAGTGKTVVALHRAKWLAENRCTADQKILVTTFTKNLATDIASNLAAICLDGQMAYVEVVNLDRWVNEFLQRNNYRFTIDYGKQADELWRKAFESRSDSLDSKFDEKFFREEWANIIQPEEVLTLKEYFKVSRTGRGIRMGRKERKLVWPVFEEYRVLQNERGIREPADAMRDACGLLQHMGKKPFNHVIVDEAQDMSSQAFKLLRTMVDEHPNDIFITGDAHQRIYGRPVVLGRCGIEVRGRSKKLKINYRTTDEIKTWAISVLQGVSVDDLDGGEDRFEQYTSLLHGENPSIKRFENVEKEVEGVVELISALKANGLAQESLCVVARTNSAVDSYGTMLNERGVPTYRILGTAIDERKKQGVRLATMHRVKGLEFDAMIIAGANADMIPNAALTTDDPMVKVSILNKERALLHVAATRAKKYVFVTGYGEQSPFLEM